MSFLSADVCYWQGEFISARSHLNNALIPWDPPSLKALTQRTGLDAHCIGLAYLGMTDFAMGYPERARHTLAESVRDAQKVGNAQTIGHCLGVAGWLAVFMRDVNQARNLAARTIEYCKDQRLLFWEASGYLVDGWVLIQEGSVDEGIARVHQGIEIRCAAGAALVHTSFFAILAECHLHSGEFDKGFELIAKGLTHIAWSGECLSESELYRIRGELILARGADIEAATLDFQRAIAVAVKQDGKLC